MKFTDWKHYAATACAVFAAAAVAFAHAEPSMAAYANGVAQAVLLVGGMLAMQAPSVKS